MMKYKETRDNIIRLLKARGSSTVAIYPFGDRGLDFKIFIDNIFPTMKYVCVDNVLAEYNPNIHTLKDFVQNYYKREEVVFLLTVCNNFFWNSLIQSGIDERDITHISRGLNSLTEDAMIYYATRPGIETIYDYDAWFIRHNYISRQLYHSSLGWNYEICKKRWLTMRPSNFPVQDVIYEHVTDKPVADVLFYTDQVKDFDKVTNIVAENRSNCKQMVFFNTGEVLDDQVITEGTPLGISREIYGTLKLLTVGGI